MALDSSWDLDEIIRMDPSLSTSTSAAETVPFNTTSVIRHNPQSRLSPYPEWLVIILWLLTALFSIGTILGNLLVLLAYKLERSIRRQLSNKFIVSLAITDLIIGMEGFPLLTVYVVGRERWPLGATLCQIWLCLDYTLCLVSILTVLLITVDRYGSVCYPAKYRTWQTNARVRIFIVGSWVVPFLFFGVMIFAWDALTGNRMDDGGKCYAPFLNDPFVNMSMYIVYYWTTLVAVSVLYRGIHTAAKTLEDKSKARERQTIALLLGQRCMAQVGVGMLLTSQAGEETQELTCLRAAAAAAAAEEDQAKEMTEMGHDSGYMTTSATATTHTTFSGGVHAHEQRGSLGGTQCQIQAALNVPIIITQSPPSSISLSSTKVSPARLSPPPESTTTVPAEQGDQFKYEESMPLVPMEENTDIDRAVSQSPPVTASPVRVMLASNPQRKAGESIHRRLTMLHSLVSSPKKWSNSHSVSLDDYHIRNNHKDTFESGKRSYSMIERRRKWSSRFRRLPKQPSIFHQESRSSLEFYADSNCTSMSSIYGDASLHSVLEFDALLSALDSVESTETSTSASTIMRGQSLRNRGKHISDFLMKRISSWKDRRHQENGDLMRTSSVTSSTWTRSASTSIKSQYSGQMEETRIGRDSPDASPIKALFQRSNSVKLTANKNHVEKLDQGQQKPDTKSQTPSPKPISHQTPQDSFLPPIIEEEKSTTTRTEAELISRRSSMAPSSLESPPALIKSEPAAPVSNPDRKPQPVSEKVVHLTVPGQVPYNPTPSRKSSSSSRRSTDQDWQRASWQSTASSIYRLARRKTRKKGARAIDDDEDSEGREPGSSADDSNSDRKRSTSWLTTLFSNPVSILHRKRKVTKAEKRARKAFRTITVIVGTFALFWSPYYIVATIYGFCQDCVPAPLFLTSYYLCYLNSSVNPFAYAFANRLFRKTFIRILRGDLRRT